MKRKRICRHCRDHFYPDPRSYRPTTSGKKVSTQRYCPKPECRAASHRSSNKIFWKKDDGIRSRNAVACRAWRKKNKAYWAQRREKDPVYTKGNREQQKRRDKQRRGDLANTDTIEALRRDKLGRIRHLIHLANTDPIRVPWTLVAEEIRLFLVWLGRLANTNAIDPFPGNNQESVA